MGVKVLTSVSILKKKSLVPKLEKKSRCLGTCHVFSAIITKGNNFQNFVLLSLRIESFRNGVNS